MTANHPIIRRIAGELIISFIVVVWGKKRVAG